MLKRSSCLIQTFLLFLHIVRYFLHLADGILYISNQLSYDFFNFLRTACRFLCKISDFLCHNSKSSACFPGSGCFYAGIEGKQIRLVCQALDDFNRLINICGRIVVLICLLRYHINCLNGCLCNEVQLLNAFGSAYRIVCHCRYGSFQPVYTIFLYLNNIAQF